MSQTMITELSPAVAAERARRDEIVLVDVRELDERLSERPADSLHIPLGDLGLRLDELPRDRTVAFICLAGGRSSQAAQAAASIGLDVANVDGGMLAWKRAGLPVGSGAERPR